MNAERLKQKLINTYEPAKALALWVGVAVLVVIGITVMIYVPPLLKGLAHSAEAGARQTEDVTGKLASVATRFDSIAAKVEEKVDPILANAEEGTGSLKEAAGSFAARLPTILDSLNGIGPEATKLIADVRSGPLPALTTTVNSVNGLIVEAKPDLLKAVSNVKDATGSLKDAADTVEKAMKDPELKAWISEALSHGKSIIANFDTVSQNLTLTTDGTNKISANLARMTKDSADKLHTILFPEKVHGFWPNVKRTLSFLITPVLEGGRIYLSLHTLPVKITQPVPILKAP